MSRSVKRKLAKKRSHIRECFNVDWAVFFKYGLAHVKLEHLAVVDVNQQVVLATVARVLLFS